MKFIHAADIHLDSPLERLTKYEGAPVDEIRSATRRALARLVDLALDEQVDLLLVAGDVYDGDWNDYNTGLYFVGQMARLAEKNIPVVLIAGNHDAANLMTRRLSLPSNVTMLPADQPGTVELAELGVAVHGQSFSERAVLENLAAAYPSPVRGRFNIGLLHTCATGDAGHEPYAPCSVADLVAKEYDYWALGHVHDRRCLNESPPIWFSGNLQGRHPRETGAKGCLLVTVDDAGEAEVAFRPLDVFRWETIALDATDIEDEESLLERFGERIEAICAEHEGLPLAVRVTLGGATALDGSLHADGEHWQNQLRATAIAAGSGRVWLEKIRFETTPPVEALEELPDDGPIGELRSYLRELMSPESDEVLIELGAEIEALRKQLPPELRDDPALAFDNPETIRTILADVEPLLLQRLQCEWKG